MLAVARLKFEAGWTTGEEHFSKLAQPPGFLLHLLCGPFDQAADDVGARSVHLRTQIIEFPHDVDGQCNVDLRLSFGYNHVSHPFLGIDYTMLP